MWNKSSLIYIIAFLLLDIVACGTPQHNELVHNTPAITANPLGTLPTITVQAKPIVSVEIGRDSGATTMNQFPIPGTSLADEHCVTPCWKGIRLGVTTVSELLAILESDQAVGDIRIYQEPLGSLAQSAILWTESEVTSAEALFYPADDLIIGVNADFYRSVEFVEIQKVYGDPSHVIFRVDPGEHAQDGITYTLSLLYLDYGIELGFVPYGKGGISSDTLLKFKTKRVTFFPASLQGYLALEYRDKLPSWVVPWSSTKSLRDYCLEGHVGDDLWLAEYCPT